MKDVIKNCVISAVGKNSLHKGWISGRERQTFDLHLIVYDDSIDSYKDDTSYICHLSGQKLRLIYQYVQIHPEIVEQYDYFFFPDDDIEMDSKSIARLFDIMRDYNLQIAQPSLRNSYYTWEHVLRDNCCRLRYTNFVEMMVPCFSRNALKKVLFTFNENSTGWGTETHWPLLIGSNQHDMAIIDDVSVVHTRPIQSGTPLHIQEYSDYISKYNLTTHVENYGFIPNENKSMILTDSNRYAELKNILTHWSYNSSVEEINFGLDGYLGWVEFLTYLSDITNRQEFEDSAFVLLKKIQRRLFFLKDDMTLEHGITGCCCLVEKLFGTGHVKGDPGEILEEIDAHIVKYVSAHIRDMSIEELVGVGLYYLAKLDICYTDDNKNRLVQVVGFLSDDEEDKGLMIDILMLKKACGVCVDSKIAELKSSICGKSCKQVSHVYILYKLYLLTQDEDIRCMVEEALMTLPPRLLNLRDARRMAEMLSFNVKNGCV